LLEHVETFDFTFTGSDLVVGESYSRSGRNSFSTGQRIAEVGKIWYFLRRRGVCKKQDQEFGRTLKGSSSKQRNRKWDRVRPVHFGHFPSVYDLSDPSLTFEHKPVKSGKTPGFASYKLLAD
jgi:hypothetical protein